MNGNHPVLLDHLASLSDTTRSRMLLVLDRRQLTVGEICAVMQLPQSTVSRHLKALGDGGWVTAHAEGTSNLYTMTRPSTLREPQGRPEQRRGTTSSGRPEHAEGRDELGAPARRLWQLVREQVSATPAAANDQRRLQSTLAARRSKSQEFFSSSAGQWDRVRDELFGDRFHLAALGALASEEWIVGDLGCGTGQVTAALAPFVSRVVAVDSSSAMLQSARRRLQDVGNVELRRGELEALPIDEARLDLATLMLVLHHVPEPDKALAEVARVLKPGGRVVIADMLPHDRDSYRQQMGHVWLGFPEDDMRRLMSDAGFGAPRIVALPPDPRAKGPALFVATGTRR